MRNWIAVLLGLALWTAVARGAPGMHDSLGRPSRLGYLLRYTTESPFGELAQSDVRLPAFAEPFSTQFGRDRERERRRATRRDERPTGSGSALVTALMSAVVPGAGQLRNGSILRGLGYAAIEIGGWTAYFSFRQGAADRFDEITRTADEYWSLDRYRSRAGYVDSCAACGCPNGDQLGADLDLISQASGSRYYEYLSRRPYGCGWDSEFSERLYQRLWNDRDKMQNAQSWSGRLIFLNHLVSAVDAFIEARSLHMKLDDVTEVTMKLRGLPFDLRPEVRVTRKL